MTAQAADHSALSSPFVGADVCRQAGLALPDSITPPVFDQEMWDFTHVVGLPVEMPGHQRRFDFTAITRPAWRLTAKELMLAMLAPHHPAVIQLPRAYRTPLHLRSCSARLDELVRFFAWLERRDLTSLTQLDTVGCESYLAHRRFVLDDDGTVVGEQSPAVRRSAAQAVIDLINYRDLFTADRVPADLRPWGVRVRPHLGNGVRPHVPRSVG